MLWVFLKSIDSNIIAAIIAAITSILTLLLTFLLKPHFEKHFHIFKLKQGHEYEQRKEIKKILSRNKIQLLNACESLNHRLWNFAENYEEAWHNVNRDYSNKQQNYFNSFVYRLLVIYSWIRKIEIEMVYLDTTISTQEDIEFIKYLKLLPQILCDTDLFDGFPYDKSQATDHFFKNTLENMADELIENGEIIPYNKYIKEINVISKRLNNICQFIDGITPEEKRLRWDRLQILHLTLMAFLNTFGYDFQYTDCKKIKIIMNKPPKSLLYDNFISILNRNKISKQKEIKKLIKLMK